MAEVQSTEETAQKVEFVEVELDPSLEVDTTLSATNGKFGSIAEGFQAKKAHVIEAFSDPQREIFYNNRSGFVDAVYIAFNQHIPLCFSPDDLWTLIIQGVSKHIELNAEELRSKFVDFDGKQTLRIFRDHFALGSPNNDWAGCFNEWSQQITGFIGEENREKLVPKFSTTGTLEAALHDLSLMDCMKSYFAFRCSTLCGISKVKLEGTLEDWEQLREKVEGLNEYGLEWWTEHLLPVVDKIISTYKGEVDKVFWYTIYKQWSTHGSGASTYVNGWITTFFPYVNDRKRRSFPNLDELREDASNKDNEQDWGWHGPRLDGTIEIYDVPNNISCTPFIWEYLGSEIPMSIYGGFAGCEVDGEYIRPVLGWAVGRAKSKEEKEAEEKQRNRFW